MNRSISNGVNNFVFGNSQGISVILPKIKKRIIESGPLPITVKNTDEIRQNAESLIDIIDYYGGNVETAFYYCFLLKDTTSYYVFLLDRAKKPLCRLDGTVTIGFKDAGGNFITTTVDDTIKNAFFITVD